MEQPDRVKRKALPRPNETCGGSTVDVRAIEPDELRDAVREGLTALTEDESAFIRDKLLRAVEASGVNIGGCLFLIGNMVDLPDELTASDLAQLVRYVRLNKPRALDAARTTLRRLLSLASAARGRTRSRLAA
jgi:hypothetical protein